MWRSPFLPKHYSVTNTRPRCLRGTVTINEFMNQRSKVLLSLKSLLLQCIQKREHRILEQYLSLVAISREAVSSQQHFFRLS